MTTPPLISALQNLCIILHTDTGKFPKISRYTLGTRAVDITLQLIQLTMLALYKSGKSRLLILHKIDAELSYLRILLEILWQMRALSDRRYAYIMTLVVPIGQQLGGWIQSTKE